jgi:hypothetical protein
MPEYDDLSLEELIRLAAREARDSDYPNVALASLSGAVAGNADLQLAIAEELAPRAANLELHLDGERVEGHATNALSFGSFVARVSDTVREFVKGRLNLPAFSNDLQVAVAEGSVKATFIAPDPVTDPYNTFPDGQGSDAVWNDGNLQSEALHQIAIVLRNSEPETPNEDALDEAIQLLPFGARVKLRSAIRQTVKQDWSITGEFRQRGIGIEPIHLSSGGARFLLNRLEGEEVADEPLTTTGVLDGHQWSSGIMYFIPVGGRRFPALFETPQVREQVGILDAVEGRKVEATFRVFTRVGSGDTDRKSTTYVLQSVRPLDDGPGTEFDLPE